MAKGIKDDDADWEPHTPAKKPGKRTKNRKAETKNGDMSDILTKKGADDIGTSKRKTTRIRMKRHRPKVVNENKPIKPPTPEPKTPKRPKKKREPKTSAKSSCKRKLGFTEENSIVNQKDGGSFGIAPKMFKRKRKMRKRLSLERLIRLSGLINEKLGGCKSTILNMTWVHLKRRRSRTTHRRLCLLCKGSQVVDANKPVDQCEHFDELKNNLLHQGCDPVQEAWADFTAQKMKSLCIDDGSEKMNTKHQKLQVLVRGPKKPDDETMQLVVLAPRDRKRKVDIDEETSRVWTLFIHGAEDTENDKADSSKTRLEEEREVFVGRVNSFIAAMFHFTGDRRFRRWKGSVVDSVVGVFLTQNVSDNLSSNAFMNLAAEYPPPSLREQNGSGAVDYIVHEPASPHGDTIDYTIEDEIDAPSSTIKSIPVEMVGSSSIVPIEMDGSSKLMVEIGESSSTAKPTVGRNNKKRKTKGGDENWDDLRRRYGDYISRTRGEHNADTVDWKAVRETPLGKLAKVIERRGMNNQLAERIKNFLDRLVRDHGSIDLEWLRNVPPLKAKSYLMSISGLALKSTECVRLLSLFQPAFPIDVNVGRVLVRLGWVKLQPLPEGVPIHLLNDYPELSKVQEYIWPRICNRDEQTLYELHCYMNIFSKAFCTKTNPNCNACPMKGDCKHYASALASSRLPLEFPQAKNETSESSTTAYPEIMVINEQAHNEHVYEEQAHNEHVYEDHCEPILEFPGSPEPIVTEPLEESDSLEEDIEDFGGESMIQTIILNSKEMSENFPSRFSDNNNDGASRAIVGQDPQFAHIPLPKIRNQIRLRTEHQVYELPDSHPLLNGFDRRDPNDPCPYLLAIWTTDSWQELKNECDSQRESTVGCSSAIVQHKENDIVKGTILIPCRTANRGRFPLNGTYFQINEVFADHASSREPIDVPREWIWNLPRLTLYCGTTITSICRGMSFEQIVYLFRRGYICIRGFDLKTRRSRLLMKQFHVCKTRQTVDE